MLWKQSNKNDIRGRDIDIQFVGALSRVADTKIPLIFKVKLPTLVLWASYTICLFRNEDYRPSFHIKLTKINTCRPTEITF